jgi:hypothetical protein
LKEAGSGSGNDQDAILPKWRASSEAMMSGNRREAAE